MDVKKIKGRKPHIAVDTMGNLPGVMVYAANLHDTVSGLYPAAYASTIYPLIQEYSADAGYRGTFVDEVQEVLSTRVDIVERTDKPNGKFCQKEGLGSELSHGRIIQGD